MRLLFPLGLLGLLGIPVLIIIYIIKSKYTEQVITSTYLWTLSERFLKRKNPINRITGIISLILQILAVLFISIGIAHPVFTLKGRADDFCFILDGSGSMNIVEGGSTRFDKGKQLIRDKINSAADGSTFTLITTGDTTDVIVKESSDKKATLRQLDLTKASFAASDLSNATRVAQEYFNANPSIKYYLITDKIIADYDNVELITIGDEVENRGLDAVKYSVGADGSVTVTGNVYAYAGSDTVDVELFVDGGRESVAKAEVEIVEGFGAPFTLIWEAGEGSDSTFNSLTVKIKQKDALPQDDSATLYNVVSDASHSMLIVSDAPLFIEAMFTAYGNMQRKVVTPNVYKEAPGDYTGYGLYVFDSFTPSNMPMDGAVWFVNPDTGVDGTSGFAGSKYTPPGNTALTLNKSTSSKVRNLLKGTTPAEDTMVSEYFRCRLYRSFTTLMSCNGDPVVFAGSNAYGNREVVIAFDLHRSDFPLTYNGRAIIRNLIDYTFPSLIDPSVVNGQETLYCGDTLTVNVLANCTGIRVESPSGKVDYLDISDAMSEYGLREVGEYTVIAIIGNYTQTSKVYSNLPVAERIPVPSERTFKIVGEPSTLRRDGIYEDLLYAFIILAVIVVADWLVYCYEQYQLR